MTTSFSRDPRRNLLSVRDLTVTFSSRHSAAVRAVDAVSFSVNNGETVGIVGESGSGKSTIGRVILGLTPVSAGHVEFGGTDITRATFRERRALSADLQVVFQDPYNSLNPTRRIGQTLAETLRVHGGLDKHGIDERIRRSLERVGLSADAAGRYPSHFSGGQRQRIAIARALMASPRLVICDEPVSALDLSVQAQVLNLFRQLQRELDLSYLFIAHDLDAVRYISHRIIVLYRGRIMEQGSAAEVYEHPKHPYTRALLDAAPIPNPDLQRRRRLSRSTVERPVGSASTDACPFAPRCAYAIEMCHTIQPRVESTPDDGDVACHRWRELRLSPLTPLGGGTTRTLPNVAAVSGPTASSPNAQAEDR